MKVIYQSPIAEKIYAVKCRSCGSVIEVTYREANDWKACPVCHIEDHTKFYLEGGDGYKKIMDSIKEKSFEGTTQ